MNGYTASSKLLAPMTDRPSRFDLVPQPHETVVDRLLDTGQMRNPPDVTDSRPSGYHWYLPRRGDVEP